MDGRFTEEELAIAKSVDLCAVAESLGYTVKRIGKYHTLKEMVKKGLIMQRGRGKNTCYVKK